MGVDLFQVPGGPAHKHLEPGDVLVRVNGEVSNVLNYSWAIPDAGDARKLLFSIIYVC